MFVIEASLWTGWRLMILLSILTVELKGEELSFIDLSLSMNWAESFFLLMLRLPEEMSSEALRLCIGFDKFIYGFVEGRKEKRYEDGVFMEKFC
jgi:hypothetical protein